jgi:hypothetical protein
MTTANNIEKNNVLSQRALTRLTELSQQAEHEQVHGKVIIEVTYRNGVAEHVRAMLETRHHN